VKGPRTYRIQPRMGHGHPPGWAPAEIGIFVDSILKGGVPLPTVGEMSVHAETVTVPFSSATKVVKAELHYTTATGKRSDREWKSLAADVEEDKIIAKGLPADVNTWLMTLTDERGAMVTSAVGLR
jgi:hypothetical protein